MFLGIDIGTSGVKATVTDIRGKVIANAYRVLNTYGQEEKKRELNPIEVKNYVFEILKEVIQKGRPAKISMITVSSLGEAVIPVSRCGEALSMSIIGSDPRGARELEWITEQIGEQELTDITKVNVSYIYSINKILYIKKHYPSIHQNTWKYMCFTDYVGYLLTGETKIDYSMASRTMAFDIHTNCWSKKILETAGIEEGLFSNLVQGGSIIGTLLPSVKRFLGIDYEIPVMAGSHDHIFNAIGAGVTTPGSCSNIVGTTEGITAVLERILSTQNISAENISCEPFVRAGLYNTVAWHNAAGAMVNWYIDTFWKEKAISKGQILAYLNHTLDSEPGNLMVLPHFAGATAGYMDEKAKGAFIGLTMMTTREEIFKSILEGASYECRRILESLANSEIPIDRIIVSGGGSNSKLWLQLKANILGREIYRFPYSDTGALGGAVAAASALGEYPSLEEAAKEMLGEPELIEPDMKCHRVYQERYEAYQELYSKLKNVNHILD